MNWEICIFFLLLRVILKIWFNAIVNLQRKEISVSRSQFCCSVYFYSRLATRFCSVWHCHPVVTKKKCSDCPPDAVGVCLLSRPLCARPAGYGGPHDVHHSLPADGQSGPRRLEASVVGLQLVLHVSSHPATKSAHTFHNKPRPFVTWSLSFLTAC